MDKSGFEEQTEHAEHTEHLGSPLQNSFDTISPDAIGGQSVSDLPPNYYRSFRVIGTIIAFALGYVVSFSALVMPSTALSIINEDLGPSADVVWILLSNSLGAVITFLTFGRLSDIFGRRWFFIGANTLALVGYLVAGTAQSISTLIGGNLLSGIGAGVQISGAILIGELVPNKYRFLSYAICAGTFLPVQTLGPVIARVLCDQTEQGWRWIYYIVAIVTVFTILLQLLCYFPPKFDQLHQGTSKKTTLKRLDYVGILLLTGSTATLLLGISWGGQRYPWKSANVIAAIVVGGVGLIAFVVWENFSTSAYPVIPLYLFRKRDFDCLTILASVVSMNFYALNIIWPQQIAILFGQSTTNTGWISSTIPGGASFGVILCGCFAHLIKNLKWQIVILTVIFVAFVGAMASVDGSNLGMPVAFSIISSIATGWVETLCANAGPLVIDNKDMGVANGVQWGVRTALSSLATSIYVTIVLGAGLPSSSLEKFLAALGTGNQAAVVQIPGVTEQILTVAAAAAHVAYLKAFQVVYYTSLAFGLLGLIASLCLSKNGLDSRMTSEVSRKIHGVTAKDLTSQPDDSEK